MSTSRFSNVPTFLLLFGQCIALVTGDAYVGSRKGERCSMEEVGVHVGVLNNLRGGCRAKCSSLPHCAAYDGLMPSTQLFTGQNSLQNCVLYSKVPTFVEDWAGDGSNQCHMKALPTWLNKVRDRVQVVIANLSSQIDAIPQDDWSAVAEEKDEALQHFEQYQAALDTVEATWEGNEVLRFIEQTSRRLLYFPPISSEVEEYLGMAKNEATELGEYAKAHRLLSFIEGFGEAAHTADETWWKDVGKTAVKFAKNKSLRQQSSLTFRLHALEAEFKRTKETLAAKDAEVMKVQSQLKMCPDSPSSDASEPHVQQETHVHDVHANSSALFNKSVAANKSQDTTVDQESLAEDERDSGDDYVDEDISQRDIEDLVESWARNFDEKVSGREAFQSQSRFMSLAINHMQFDLVKMILMIRGHPSVKAACCGTGSSRRSGPGDGGFVTLEVDKIVNPKRDTLAAMIKERCPSLNVRQPCGRKSYCQVEAPFSQQADVECVIAAIAQNKEITGFRIKEIDRWYESPRD